MRRQAALAAAVACLAAPGCGGDGDRGGDLVWAKPPLVFTPEGLPRDRILSGRLRNESLERVELDAAELTLVDRNGRRVPGRSVFLQTFAHQLYPPTREPAGGQPESELRRLGVKARIEPGRDVPVTIAWRQKPGEEPPVRLRFPGGSLPLR